MRFFVSSHYATGEGNTFCVLITMEAPSDPTALRDMLKDEFGPWMLIGVKEYSKENFLQNFTDYIPPTVLEAINLQPHNFLYKAAIHANYS
jgi:hypothetical protein